MFGRTRLDRLADPRPTHLELEIELANTDAALKRATGTQLRDALLDRRNSIRRSLDASEHN